MQEGEQKFLMTLILDVYDRIFGTMENETHSDKVKMNLRDVKDQLNKLKEHYYSGKHADLKSYVNNLLSLKVGHVREAYGDLEICLTHHTHYSRKKNYTNKEVTNKFTYFMNSLCKGSLVLAF